MTAPVEAAELAGDPTVWCLTTGEAGLRQQARGLARELSPKFEERVVRVSRLAALAPPRLFAQTLSGVTAIEGGLTPPWPDVLISAGRRASLAAMAIRHQSATPITCIHIQSPSVPEAFDLVVAMPHDRLEGRNVVQVETALHGVRPQVLAAAAAAGDARFAHLPSPWTGVLIGGDTAQTPFTAADAQRLADGLDALRQRIGGSLIMTPSRRTPACVITALRERYDHDAGVFLWAGEGANPYVPILAAADGVVVTDDSISMISEALATTADVWVFDIGGGGRRARFVQGVLDRQLVAHLGDPAPPKRREGIDATPFVAEVARGLMRSRFKVAI
jgi:mitochondrial fission protein ELM1